jgi:hypothetical protein
MIEISDTPSVLNSVAIIPFSLEEATQTIYILLAQVATGPRRGSRLRPEVWGDLGGTPEAGELPEDTAAREFMEESLGCVQAGPFLSNQLQKGKFFLRVRLHFELKGYGRFHRDFYLKQIPFDSSISTRFAATRKALLCIPNAIPHGLISPKLRDHITSVSSAYRTIAPQFLEKQALRYFSIDHIMDIISNQGQLRETRLRGSFTPALRVAVAELLRFVPET